MNRDLAVRAVDDVCLARPSPLSTDLFFVRQAEGEHELDPGATEDAAALTVAGRAQALLVGRYLQRQSLAAVYCADTRPAFETGAKIAAACDLPLTATEALRDVHFCEETVDDRPASLSAAAATFSLRPRWEVFAGAEPAGLYRRRVIQAVESIVSRHPGQAVVIVCSGGSINAYLGMVLDIPRDVFFLAGPGSISSVRIDAGRYALLGLNNCLHLAES